MRRMARKKLSMQGRAVAAGVSVAVAAGLGGFMAARDHTAEAGQPSSSSSTATDGFGSANPSSGANATTFPDDPPPQFGDDSGSSSGQFQPQPQTRTGGS